MNSSCFPLMTPCASPVFHRPQGGGGCERHLPLPFPPFHPQTAPRCLLRSVLIVLTLPFLCPIASAAPPTPVRLAHGNDVELWVSGDFNGDSLPDVAIIDRATGLLRTGHGQVGGGFLFTDPAASGVFDVTWALAAPLASSSRDDLLVLSPTSNRAQMLDLSTTAHPVPAPISAAGPGPRTAAALDLTGSSNTPEPDLLVANEFTTVPGGTGVLRGLRNHAGTFTQLGNAATNHVFDQAVAVAPDSGEPELAAWLRLESTSSTFELRTVTVTTFSLTATVPALPANTRYTASTFDSSRPDFFFYSPGSANVRVHRIDGSPGAWTFDAGTTIQFPASLRCLAAVGDSASTRRLLAIDQDGSAALAAYSRGGGLDAPHPLSSPPGTFSTGVLPLTNGEILLLGGPSAAGASTTFRHCVLDGDDLSVLASGSLPSLATAAAGANVLVFDTAPFRTPAPNLLGAYRLFDWTTNAGIDPPPGSIRAESLRFVDPSAGLGNPDRADVSATPSGGTAALVNQFHPRISVFHQGPPVGTLTVDVAPVPAGGSFRQAVQLSFTTNPPAAAVFWRKAGTGSPFSAFSTPLELVTDTTVEFYAAHAGIHSPLRTATYHFQLPPEQLDADGDGVPDFVETHLGLDAETGRDSDNDSIGDLEEIIDQTDPNDPDDPGLLAGERPDLGDLQVLDIAFHPYNGLTNQPTQPYPGTELRAFDSAATPLGMAATGSDPTHMEQAVIDCRPVDPSLRFIVAASPLHSSIFTTDLDKRRGREIVAVVPIPDPPAVVIPFTYDPSQPATQADAWISAARTAWSAAARAPLNLDLDIDRSLHLVLVERSLQTILLARGENPAGTPVSLTPFREPEAGTATKILTPADLARLEAPPAAPDAPPNAPCVLARHLATDLADRIAAPDTGISALLDLTKEIYRISSRYHNDAPGELTLPLDTLRITLTDGFLPAAYATHSTLTVAQVQAACTAAATLTGSPPAIRPRSSFLLTLATPASACTLATDESTATTYALLTADGTRFELPEDWSLLPGTKISVNAFTDGPTCSGHPSLTVIDIAFDTLVLPARNDSDADLLDDQWELFHFGNLSHSYAETLPGNSHSLGEEFFAATDPNDPSDNPPGAPVALAFGPPQLTLENGTNIRLSVTWPAAYASQIEVLVFRSTDLDSFSDTGVKATHLGAGTFEATLPSHPSPRAFYQFRARLR